MATGFCSIIAPVPLIEVRFTVSSNFEELQALKTFFRYNPYGLVHLEDLHLRNVT